MKGSAGARRRVTRNVAAASWQKRHDALLTVLNAILLAKGDGPQHRLAVANVFYEGVPRRNVAVEQVADRIVVYLEPSKEEVS